MYCILFFSFLISCGIRNSLAAFPGANVKRLNYAEMAEDQDRSIKRCRYFWKTKSRSARHARSIAHEEAMTMDKVLSDMYGDTSELRKENMAVNNTRRLNYKPDAIILEMSSEPPPPVTQSPVAPMNWHKEWNGAVIPYFVCGDSYDASMTEIIIRAFDYVSHVTCIRLERMRERPDYNSEFPWVHISNPDGIHQCVHSNHLKHNIGRQWVVLGYACLSVGEIAHEVMHVLGFGHEHSRPDRDAYVTIIWDNIKPGYKKYFELSNDAKFLSMPYDFTSVMHYPARAFTKNGKITVLSKQGNLIGQRQGYSELDLQKIRIIYDEQCNMRNEVYLQEVCPKIMEGIAYDISAVSSEEDGTDYYKDRIWKYGIVQYSFKNAEDFAPVEKGFIRSVMTYISSETCVDFQEATSGSRRHANRELQFAYGGDGSCRCPPAYGGSDEIQTVNLTRSCFNSLNDLLHIIVHTLGFEHQHLAHNRDQYVAITWTNMEPAVRAQMEHTLPQSASLGFRYDYDSIMHMPWIQHIHGKQVTMYPVWNYGWSMGHWQGLSEIDVAKINRLYGEECKVRDVAGNEITEEPTKANVTKT